ncbi:22227_t:CDS:1, partial [Racocetra persica]
HSCLYGPTFFWFRATDSKISKTHLCLTPNVRKNYAKRENVKKISVTLHEIKGNETISTLSTDERNEEKRTI